jgi:hypothetical protein
MNAELQYKAQHTADALIARVHKTARTKRGRAMVFHDVLEMYKPGMAAEVASEVTRLQRHGMTPEQAVRTALAGAILAEAVRQANAGLGTVDMDRVNSILNTVTNGLNSTWGVIDNIWSTVDERQAAEDEREHRQAMEESEAARDEAQASIDRMNAELEAMRRGEDDRVGSGSSGSRLNVRSTSEGISPLTIGLIGAGGLVAVGAAWFFLRKRGK